MSRTIVRLKILSESRTPESIENLLGLPADSCWHVGDKRAKTTIIENVNGWVLNSGLPETDSLEHQCKALLTKLKDCGDRVKSLSVEDTVVVSCVIYSSAQPALYFDGSVIAQIAALGADLDLDVYILSE